MTASLQLSRRCPVPNPNLQNNQSAAPGNKRPGPCSVFHTGSFYKTSGKAFPPCGQTDALPGSCSADRKKRCPEARPHLWSRSRTPADAPASAFPSPCIRDDQNIHRVTCRGEKLDYYHGLLVLLCYKRLTQQKGQQGSCRSRILAMRIRSVAMERGLCRSARTRRAAGLEPGWNLRGA
jgi:hypothetical protein